ncbi:MAG: DnaA/Hda family protein [Planctomycetota bacterium]|nr:DnaA/Hda family protein [Planctomycetota bacterium]
MVEAALVAQVDNWNIEIDVETAADVRRTLIARIGQERLNLWFGAGAVWKRDQSGVVIDLESSFLLDCVKSFCWDELKAAVVETLDENTPIRLVHTARPKASKVLKSTALKSAAILQASGVSTGCNGSSAIVSSDDQSAHGSVSASTTLEKTLGGANQRSDSSTINAPIRLPFPSSNSSTLYPQALQNYEANAGSSAQRVRMVTDASPWKDFIPGPSNRLAYTAAEMILERPGTLSPLLLHGGSGVGKTHLSKALAEQLRLRHGLRRVLVMTAEQFTIDYSESARGGGFASFRKKYRDVDGFILDDLAFCLGKQQTLSELRNTIDNLIRNNKQVVLVSDRPLNELTGLGSDLHARISGGMTCNLDPLDGETRRELLERLLQRHGIEIPDSAVTTLSKSCGGDGRALFGIAFRLLAQQRAVGRKLTHDESIAASLELIRACQPVVRITDIEKAVCDSFRLDPKCLQEKGKAKTISAARMLAMFLARKHTQAAYAEIGEYFGHRQHSTVISAHRKVQQWLDANTPLQRGSTSVNVRDVVRSLETALQVG